MKNNIAPANFHFHAMSAAINAIPAGRSAKKIFENIADPSWLPLNTSRTNKDKKTTKAMERIRGSQRNTFFISI